MEGFGHALVPLFIGKDHRQLLIENAHHSLDPLRDPPFLHKWHLIVTPVVRPPAAEDYLAA